MQTLGANTQYLTPKYAPPDSEPHKATKITKQYLCICPVNGSVYVDVVDDNEKPIQGEYNVVRGYIVDIVPKRQCPTPCTDSNLQ